jgi:DNA-binding IscR family transcriptional regulator
MPELSGQAALALRTLRALADTAAGADVARLAATLATTEDRLLELFAPLTYAGWVTRDAADPSLFRYTRPVPPPTVHEVIDAVDGAGAIDDCVLRPGVGCAALASAAVCTEHHAWQRQLNRSALLAVPLVGALRAPSWRTRRVDAARVDPYEPAAADGAATVPAPSGVEVAPTADAAATGVTDRPADPSRHDAVAPGAATDPGGAAEPASAGGAP